MKTLLSLIVSLILPLKSPFNESEQVMLMFSPHGSFLRLCRHSTSPARRYPLNYRAHLADTITAMSNVSAPPLILQMMT